MCLCVSLLALEWKRRAFIEKVNTRCFCWFPATILVYQNCPPIWRLHTKLYKGVWNVSGNNSETVGYKDLRFGQIVYILVFYNICFSWHLPLDGFQFFAPCLLRTVERKNQRDFFLWIKSTLSFPLILWALPIARFAADELCDKNHFIFSVFAYKYYQLKEMNKRKLAVQYFACLVLVATVATEFI